MNERKQAQLIRWPQVHLKTGICRSHAHALAAKGRFPQPIKVGGARASAWVAGEIDDWIEEQIVSSRKSRGVLK